MSRAGDEEVLVEEIAPLLWRCPRFYVFDSRLCPQHDVNSAALKNHALPLGTLALGAIAITALVTFLPMKPGSGRWAARHGEVIHETVSEFSRIRVREREDVRSLFFVDKKGKEKLQSQIDLGAPHELQLRYSRAMFASLLFREKQERVLIVGLGGGGMVRFLNHALPETHVDAVEIDPEVVRIAAEFFGTTGTERTSIHTADAFDFLREPNGPYDVIYMDAFLRPPAELTVEDKTQRLKTEAFLRNIQQRLVPGGLVAFNLIEADKSTAADLAAIRSSFPAVRVFPVPETGNLVVMGLTQESVPATRELLDRSIALEAKPEPVPSLTGFVEGMRAD